MIEPEKGGKLGMGIDGDYFPILDPYLFEQSPGQFLMGNDFLTIIDSATALLE